MLKKFFFVILKHLSNLKLIDWYLPPSPPCNSPDAADATPVSFRGLRLFLLCSFFLLGTSDPAPAERDSPPGGGDPGAQFNGFSRCRGVRCCRRRQLSPRAALGRDSTRA